MLVPALAADSPLCCHRTFVHPSTCSHVQMPSERFLDAVIRPPNPIHSRYVALEYVADRRWIDEDSCVAKELPERLGTHIVPVRTTVRSMRDHAVGGD